MRPSSLCRISSTPGSFLLASASFPHPRTKHTRTQFLSAPGGVALVENLFGMILEFLLSPRSYLLSYSCLIGHLFAKFLLQAPLGLGPVSRTWQMVRGKEQVLMAWQTRPQMRGGSRPGTLVRGALLLCDLQTRGRRGKIVILVPPWAFPLLSGEEI